jgi:hypothetical protein
MSEVINNTSYDSEIEEILNGCVIENGKLVPAPSVIDDPGLYDYTADMPHYAASDQKPVVVQGEIVSQADTRGKRVCGVLARTALISAITVLPIQAADAFTSNRDFFEVNIIEDGVHAAENATVIGNNIATTYTNTKSTLENMIKFANGGR